MERQYFLTDLDGTLLRSDTTLSDFTVDVLNQTLAEGHVCSFATARSFISAKPLVESIGWSYPVIVYNGALIVDPQSERILHAKFLSSDVTTQILEFGRRTGLMPLVFGMEPSAAQRVWHEELISGGLRRFVESRPGDPRFRTREPLSLRRGDQVIMLTYIASKAELQPFKDHLIDMLNDQIHVHFTRDTYLRDDYFLEISHPHANKEEAMKAWASLVGCSPSDVTVFGDNLNDIGLFRGAGKKLAVANAHQELQVVASEMIETNDQDGVAKYIHASCACQGSGSQSD